jgi:TPR repeat protein
VPAAYSLGNAYSTGQGVPANPETAAYWLMLAANP